MVNSISLIADCSFRVVGRQYASAIPHVPASSRQMVIRSIALTALTCSPYAPLSLGSLSIVWPTERPCRNIPVSCTSFLASHSASRHVVRVIRTSKDLGSANIFLVSVSG